MTQNPTPFHGQASIHSDAVVRNLMAKTGLDDYLNREGVTEVLINREREVFLETSVRFWANWRRPADIADFDSACYRVMYL